MLRCQPYDDESRRGPVELRLKGGERDNAGQEKHSCSSLSHLSLIAKKQKQKPKTIREIRGEYDNSPFGGAKDQLKCKSPEAEESHFTFHMDPLDPWRCHCPLPRLGMFSKVGTGIREMINGKLGN